MRPVLIAALVALVACIPDPEAKVPPLDSFYFPTGIAHAPAADPAKRGTLYVATSDFDKRYDYGAVTAVDLDALAWPGATPGSPAEITDLKVSEQQRVLISPFAGQMGVFQKDDGTLRLFVPTRSEGDNLFAMEASGPSLTCFGGDGNDCTGVPTSAISLTSPGANAGEEATADGYRVGKPRAPQPYGVAVRQSDGTIFVTHLGQADSPIDSRKAQESFVVTLNANDPKVDASSFIPIGVTPSNGVAVGRRYAYLTGKVCRECPTPPALRLVERQPGQGAEVIAMSSENAFRLFDTRGVALSEDERTLFLLTRSPDALLVLDVSGAQTDTPALELTRAVLLPSGVNDVKVIPRGPGRGALLAITCSAADAVAIYDDETGQLASVLPNIGRQPFSIAVHASTTSKATLYVTSFSDGRIAVIDLPDLNKPYEAALTALLGSSHVCLTGIEETGCTEVAP